MHVYFGLTCLTLGFWIGTFVCVYHLVGLVLSKLFSYKNLIIVRDVLQSNVAFTFGSAAKRWPDDNAYSWPWNNCCCSHLGCFPTRTSMFLDDQLSCVVLLKLKLCPFTTRLQLGWVQPGHPKSTQGSGLCEQCVNRLGLESDLGLKIPTRKY